MAFSSAAFLFAFLPIIFLLHSVLRDRRVKNALLIVASLLFYSAGSLRHLPLLLAVTVVSYLAGLLLQRDIKCKKLLLTLTLILELGALFAFKYLDFFTSATNGIFGLSLPLADLALPIGISFFTFQGISYAIDTYRDPQSGTRSFWELLLFLSFFPQLIQGPILRFHDVAPQLRERTATLDDIAAGCRRFILGLSKKLLIADILSAAVDAIFAHTGQFDIRLSAAGAILYSLQLFFDFSGYSDMALGLGRMFGFQFKENFDHPYTASTVQEFWRRWHISLSLWFRDYLYIPLGGNRKGKLRTCLNVLIVFLLTGLWHGASWTFILWGLWHGLWSVLERVTPLKKLSGTVFGHIYTLLVVVLGFVLFRAGSVSQALSVLGGFGCFRFAQEATLLLRGALTAKVITAAVFGILLSTGLQRKITAWAKDRKPLQTAAYAGALVLFALCILRLSASSFSPFIYAQF